MTICAILSSIYNFKQYYTNIQLQSDTVVLTLNEAEIIKHKRKEKQRNNIRNLEK